MERCQVSIKFKLKSSVSLCYELYTHLIKAYKHNYVPTDWITTYTIPLPKVRNPQSINDYRKLTMSSIAYKIYVKILLNYLEKFLPPIDHYQFGFLPNRSTDDMLFVIRSIMDNNWNHGIGTYLFSFDMRKAFDTVKISLLPSLMTTDNIPAYLINRIISCVLKEQNCISWRGQYSQFINKSIGVKQGCPMSPRLFIIVLDKAIKKAKEELAVLGIHLCTGNPSEDLTIPFTSAYADDLYVIAKTINEGVIISEVLLKCLAVYGLELNPTKSGILLKSPTQTIPCTIQVGSHLIPTVTSLKVLGTTINSHMERKSIIRKRVMNTVRMVKSIMPHLRNLRAPMTLLLKLYNTIVLPMLVYGLKSVSLTQQNKRTLMNREITILKDLASIAYPKPPQILLSQLLNNRTINRLVSVYRIRYYSHITRSHPSSILHKALKYSLNSPKRVGRPLKTFNDTLLEDLSKYDSLGYQHDAWNEIFPYLDQVIRTTSEIYDLPDLDDDLLPSDLYLYEELEDINWDIDD